MAQDSSADAQMAELQTKVKVLQLQKKIDSLAAQKQAIEKRQKALPPPSTTEVSPLSGWSERQLYWGL